jgi:beta-galactosidase GanA
LSDSPEANPNPTPHLHIGAAWHPEHWPEDQWPLDIARMKEIGINCVRLFESAWHRFEPREWEFDFDWATRILDQLRDASISVIIATPTAAPPAWMCAKYPEILRVTPDGRRVTHGHPRPYSVVSSRYREFCARVIDQMVHAFRNHDAVIGWQVDDRIGGMDFGNEARRAFHNWLHERFGQVESLNTTWGAELDSQAYEYFEQVPIPTTSQCHPSLIIAFKRFINDQWSSFIQVQCEVIRAGFEKPISTNMTSNLEMNYFRQNHLLDRVGMDLQQADLPTSLTHLDRMRGEKPGTPYWNLGASCDSRSAAAQAWLSILSGGELVLLNEWRQPWSGPDMNQPAIVTPTGRWSASKGAIATLADQLKEQAEYLHLHPPVEARIGVIMSNESAWAFTANPPELGFDYETIWRTEFYHPIAQSHFWRDVIDQTADFCPYNVLVMPLVPIVFRPTKERLKEWVTEGGCLLLGPLTGHRTEEFTAWTDQEFGGLEDLIGATCSASFSADSTDAITIIWGTDAPPKPQTAAELSSEATDKTQSSPRVQHLIELGRSRGYLTYEELNDKLPDEAVSADSLDALLATLEHLGIKLVDAANTPPAADLPPMLASPGIPQPNSDASTPNPSSLPSSAPKGQCHAFSPTTAHVLARYQTGSLRQDAAILINKVGQGTVITLGARVDRESYLDLIHTLCELAKIEPLATGSPHVAIVPRMNPDTTIAAYGLVNLTSDPQTITLPNAGTDRLTSRSVGPEITIEPQGVMVVELTPNQT